MTLSVLRANKTKKRVLRRISGPKRDEVRGGWRKLHNEELVLFANYNQNDQRG
jgi:hypothetical protein